MLLFVLCFKQKAAYDIVICDWSSDWCASDLLFLPSLLPAWPISLLPLRQSAVVVLLRLKPSLRLQSQPCYPPGELPVVSAWSKRWDSWFQLHFVQIGRASCRERVCQYV